VTPYTPVQYPYVDRHPSLPGSGLMPFLPISLARGGHSISVLALLDTGASVNVLPFDSGLQLGADWDKQTVVVPLAGNLSAIEARGLIASVTVGPFPAVKLGFAWARLSTMPLILGQANFFEEFDVCFFRSRAILEIRPRS
jgi:hypothetical protein